MTKGLKNIKLLLLFLWTIIMFHEIIPHHHPDENAECIKIYLNNENEENENKGDENGILDNLVVVKNEVITYIKPSITFLTFNFLSPNYIFDYNTYVVNDLKYFKSKSPPFKDCSTSIPLLRAPPFS